MDTKDKKIDTEVAETYIKFVRRNLSTFIHYLLDSELIERKKLSDPEYVWRAIAKNLSGIENDVGVIVRLDEQFIVAAKDAIEKDRLEVAIVLLAVSVEHRVNDFFRATLETQGILTTKEINH